MRAARRSAPTTRRRICCTRRCGRCSAITSRSAARWCAPDRLRFDFAHPKPISAEELRAESRTSPTTSCCRTREVTTRLMAVDDAHASGARALFGEKYGDEVRVVSMGAGRRQRARLVGRALRRHACAAHRRYRHDLGDRRERGRLRRAPHRGADRQRGARTRRNASIQTAKAAAAELRTSLDDMPARIAALMDERKQARARPGRRAQEARDGRRRSRPAAARPPTSAPSATSNSSAASCRASRSRISRALPTTARSSSAPASSRSSATAEDGKAGVVVGVTADLTARFNAVELVARPPKRSAARAAAASPTWRRPAGPTARRPTPRWKRSRRRSAS